MNKFFPEFFRRDAFIVFKKPGKVGVVLKVQLIRYFKNTHSGIRQ
jgi:hypothetical protein